MAKSSKSKKKVVRDIPLANIPERTRTSYPLELKQRAVKMVKDGKSMEEVARELGIGNGGMVGKWVRTVNAGLPLNGPGGKRPGAGGAHKPVDVMGEMRSALARARAARDERLEMAAFIVESDATVDKDGADIAKRIRSMKRPQ